MTGSRNQDTTILSIIVKSIVPIMDEILLTYTRKWKISITKRSFSYPTLEISMARNDSLFQSLSSTSVSRISSNSLKEIISVVIKQHDIFAGYEVACFSCSYILSFDHRARYEDLIRFCPSSFTSLFITRLLSTIKARVHFHRASQIELGQQNGFSCVLVLQLLFFIFVFTFFCICTT